MPSCRASANAGSAGGRARATAAKSWKNGRTKGLGEGMAMGLPASEGNDASAVPVAPLPLRRSLRARGLLATLALFAYLLASVAWVAAERGRIYDSVQALQQLSRQEKALALAEAALGSALADAAASGEDVSAAIVHS